MASYTTRFGVGVGVGVGVTPLVKVFVPIHFFVKTITYVALKLTTLIHHHYLCQQTREHNSVKVFVRIMTLFLLKIFVKFFVPIHIFFKTVTDMAPKLRIFFHHQ